MSIAIIVVSKLSDIRSAISLTLSFDTIMTTIVQYFSSWIQIILNTASLGLASTSQSSASQIFLPWSWPWPCGIWPQPCTLLASLTSLICAKLSRQLSTSFQAQISHKYRIVSYIFSIFSYERRGKHYWLRHVDEYYVAGGQFNPLHWLTWSRRS